MRCTCNRSVVALTSASSTRRTKFRSLDHRCSRHLLYSPETEYFDSARSNATAPSSTTTAARAPSRHSASIWLRDSGATFSELFASPEMASVIDGPRNCLFFWLGTGVAGDDRKAASYEQPPSRLLVARCSWLPGFCPWGKAVKRRGAFSKPRASKYGDCHPATLLLRALRAYEPRS